MLVVDARLQIPFLGPSAIFERIAACKNFFSTRRHNAMVGISVEPLTVIEGLTPAAQVGVKRLHLKLVITSLILVLNGLMINVMTLTYLNVLFTDGSLQCFFVYGIQPEDA